MNNSKFVKLLNDKLNSLGDKAKEKLSSQSDVSVSTIRGALAGIPPGPSSTRKLAVACGLSRAEAEETVERVKAVKKSRAHIQ